MNEWVAASVSSVGKISSLSTRLGSTFSMASCAPLTGQMYQTYAASLAATSGS